MGGASAIQWFFAAVSIAGFFYACYVLPETHNKELWEIEQQFQKKDRHEGRRTDSKQSENA
jgi:hypothetical protein